MKRQIPIHQGEPMIQSFKIASVGQKDLPACLETIHKAFAINCERFGFTRESYPTCAAFLTIEELIDEKENGTHIYGAWVGESLVGCVQLQKDFKNGEKSYTFKRFAVLPEYQHGGIGKALVAHCRDRAATYGGTKMRLLMVYENEVLRSFYEACGFRLIETGRDADHPFLFGIYEIEL